MVSISNGSALLIVVAIIFIVFIIINVYIFSTRNAIYFNKRNWSNKMSGGTGISMDTGGGGGGGGCSL